MKIIKKVIRMLYDKKGSEGLELKTNSSVLFIIKINQCCGPVKMVDTCTNKGCVVQNDFTLANSFWFAIGKQSFILYCFINPKRINFK